MIWGLLLNKYTIGAIILAMLVGYIVYLQTALHHQTIKAQDYKQLATPRGVIRIHDKQGREHLETGVASIGNKNDIRHDSMVMSLIKEVAKLRNVVSVAQTTTNTVTRVYTHIKDSITIHHDTIECLKAPWTDGYTTLAGCFSETMPLTINYRDTLDVVVYSSRPHHFWFIKWGTSIITSDSKLRNPNSKIMSNRTIMIKQ